MKLLFVRPKMSSTIEKEEPLSVLYLISYLKEKIDVLEIEFIDAHESRMEPEDIYQRVVQKRYDFLLITILTIGAPFAYKLVSLIKGVVPKATTKVIFGGPHPTACPEECLLKGADYCIIGEGEVTTYNLVKAIINNESVSDIKGLAYFEHGSTFKINPEQRLIQDLSQLKFPDFTSIIKKSYETTIHLRTGNKALPIMASRGCVKDCPFCCSKLMWKRKLRFRSVQNVIDELAYNYEFNNIREFHFYDDDFLINKKFILEFASSVLQRNLKIKYCCLATCKSFLSLEPDEIDLLKCSGMSLIEFGIESLVPEVLAYLHKTYTVDDLLRLISKLNENQINAYPLLMYMVPGETLNGHLFQSELFLKTFGRIPYVMKEWELRPDLFLLYAASYTPFPGTTFWKEVKQYGILLNTKWENFNTEKIIFIPNSLLKDIPMKSLNDLNTDIISKVDIICKRTLIADISTIIYDLALTLWEVVDGKKNLFSISEIIYNKFKGNLSREESFAFTVTATLTILLNTHFSYPK